MSDGQKCNCPEEGLPEWIMSYADMITILMAFFVVMYAVSSINEGKYRVLSDSLSEAFGGPPKSIKPLQFGTKQQRGSDIIEAAAREGQRTLDQHKDEAAEHQNPQRTLGLAVEHIEVLLDPCPDLGRLADPFGDRGGEQRQHQAHSCHHQRNERQRDHPG